ncbi:hypothetical protein BJV82DRAFT_29277 [Fennellomyces sp. T-0311]|nr:hypothetical protein BJV82DRAFT_29277 [Fennellomyces sp. T-0311]
MGHVRKKGKSTLLKQSCTKTGYARVTIRYQEPDINGDFVTTTYGSLPLVRISVSRLVAAAFVDGYNEIRDIVLHLNGNRQDNRAQNLRWDAVTADRRMKAALSVKVPLVDDPEIQK